MILMAPQSATPGDGERRAFVEKVIQFRSGLAPSEQQMLDAVLGRAVAGGSEDVQGYGLLDSAQGLGDKIVAFLEEWATQTVPLDEDGRPLMYGTPGL
jgi:hypothetical protein